jgi:thiosulfate/3-mercaptopyruvate sulfurtransferase
VEEESMKYTTLITVEGLAENYDRPDWVVVDCHFMLDEIEAGARAYLREHIPGALYAHLDRDLSGEIIPGKTSRHPLPSPEEFTKRLSSWGIDGDTQVVAYDNRGGGIAVRLWWMLKWLGHEAAAVMDGSFSHWKATGFPVTDEIPKPSAKTFVPKPRPELIAPLEEVIKLGEHPEKLLVDSRAPERYRGETEPIDPVAGHIPGAVNRFFMHNLGEDGKLRGISELKEIFLELTGGRNPEDVIFYCGSGVTSAHNILAMAHAGLGMPRIYPGSWSEWITDPERPIEIDK